MDGILPTSRVICLICRATARMTPLKCRAECITPLFKVSKWIFIALRIKPKWPVHDPSIFTHLFIHPFRAHSSSSRYEPGSFLAVGTHQRTREIKPLSSWYLDCSGVAKSREEVNTRTHTFQVSVSGSRLEYGVAVVGNSLWKADLLSEKKITTQMKVWERSISSRGNSKHTGSKWSWTSGSGLYLHLQPCACLFPSSHL